MIYIHSLKKCVAKEYFVLPEFASSITAVVNEPWELENT